MAATVNVKDYRGLLKALRTMEKDVQKEVRSGLRAAAEPVRQEAQDKFRPFSAESAGGYRVVVRQRGVAVEQKFRTTTGDHPEWGRLQLGVALIPALEDRSDEVVAGVEDVLDKLARRNGF